VSTVPNAYGAFLSTPAPFMNNYPALGGPHGTLLKPGGRVAAYVRSTGAQDGDDVFAASGLLVTSLNEACKRCRSGQNDIIYVLPGHTENLATADAIPDLVAGTQIISCGRPGAASNPTLTWTAAAATFLLNVADVSLVGFNLRFTGANTIAAPITISAAGVLFAGNDVDLGSGASNDCQVALTLAAGADNCKVLGNRFYASGAQNANVQVILLGAVARPVIVGNFISTTLTAATNGLIHIGAVATDIEIAHNNLINLVADGVGIRVADTFAATGFIHDNRIMLTGTTAAAAVKGISFEGTTEAIIMLAENYCSDVSTNTGIVCGTVAS
jgi:hypothetical protein